MRDSIGLVLRNAPLELGNKECWAPYAAIPENYDLANQHVTHPTRGGNIRKFEALLSVPTCLLWP